VAGRVAVVRAGSAGVLGVSFVGVPTDADGETAPPLDRNAKS
jgi:hypothetical protein